MLIWIKAPCVAIGVLAAFVLLLSTVVSEEVSINTTTDSLNLETAELTIINETDELQLMQFPFADRLINTCNLQDDTIRDLDEKLKVHYELMFLRRMLFYVNFTKQSALEVQNQTINNCADLHINNLPHTPTFAELKEMDIKGALNKIYSSLLVHTGYSYFIYHQFVSSDIRCSGDINGERRLAELSRDLADQQRFIACMFQIPMKILGYYNEDVTSSVLNERVKNLTQCSRRALRNCQVVKSINNFLQILTDYVSDYIRGSTTSLSHTERTMP